MTTACTGTHVHKRHVRIEMNARDTRYHVVRCAAKKLGWCVDNGDRVDIPEEFYGVQLKQNVEDSNYCTNQNSDECCNYNTDLSNVSNRQEKIYNGGYHVFKNNTPTNRDVRSKHLIHQKQILQIIWLDKSVVSARVRSLSSWQCINHFVGMHVIARKATLFKRLTKLITLCESSLKKETEDKKSLLQLRNALVSMTPKSFSSVSDLSALIYYVDSLKKKGERKYFIVKPNKGCEGRGIRIVSDPLTYLQSPLAKNHEEYVIQEYIDKPLLINKHKFDIRLYVVVTSVMSNTTKNLLCKDCKDVDSEQNSIKDNSSNVSGSVNFIANNRSSEHKEVERLRELDGVELYVHSEGLVRICTERYSLPSEENIDCVNMHLSNSSVNKHSANYFIADTSNHSECWNDNLELEEVYDNNYNIDKSKAMDGFKRDLAFLENYINANYEILTDKEKLEEYENEDMHELHLKKLEKEKQSMYKKYESEECTFTKPSVWEIVRDRIYKCIVLTILSGVDVLRREFTTTRASQLAKGITHGCFELLGFDILLLEENLEPVLMEVNHSPSLFCDSDLDFTIKEKVIRDTLTLIASTFCTGNNYNDENPCDREQSRHNSEICVNEQNIGANGLAQNSESLDNSNTQTNGTTYKSVTQKMGFAQLLPNKHHKHSNPSYEQILRLCKRLN